MQLRWPQATWLVIILAALSLAVFLGWGYVHEKHAGHDHSRQTEQCPEPTNKHAGHDHAVPAKKAQHDNASHAAPKAGEMPATGQVRLTPEAVQQANIKTAPVLRGSLDTLVPFAGELVFNEERLANIRSRVPGRVVRIVADYGQRVKPGDVLAIIDSVELSQAQMASRQAAVRLNAAHLAYDRARQLYEGKAISQAELQERQARVEVERADLENAHNRLRLLGAGSTPASLPPDSRASAKASFPAVAGAALALRSPIAGRVVDRKVTPGLVIKEDEELFTVADTSALWCFIQIPEKDLPLVRLGASAVITIPSLSQQEFPGRVDYLADVVDKATRTIRGRVRVDNPENLLKAGMFANVAVRLGPRATLTIPETAVQTANGEPFVFVEMAPGTYQKHRLKTGAKGAGRLEVLEGLEAGEPVVVEGGFILKSELEKGGRGGLAGCDGHSH